MRQIGQEVPSVKHAEAFRILLGLAIGLSTALQPAICQHAGGGGAGGGAGVGAGAARTTTPTTPTRTTQPPSTIDGQNRNLFLSGKVQMDDGTRPPEPVVIERVCNGQARAEGYTDSKGRFSFQLGRNLAVTQDASVEDTSIRSLDQNLDQNTVGRQTAVGSSQAPVSSSRGTPPDLMGCELRASLPGFRSDVVNLNGRRIFDNPDVGTIIMHRLANVEGTTISTTTLQAPKDARKAYDKAREALTKGKIADAQKDFEKAVSLYPQFAAAWYDLGVIHEKGNELAEARKCYSQALTADPKLITPYMSLAQLSAREKNWQDVAETTTRAIKLDPVDLPEAYYLNAAANYNLGKFDEAEASAREAQKLDNAHRFPQAVHILGLALYQKKDYAGAMEQMRNYLNVAPEAADAGQVKMQLAEIENLSSDAKTQAAKPPQ
jgi:tetratricopeptide (TPR) repeat protein